jgi:hypothetical protein
MFVVKKNTGFELATLGMIGTDCTGSCKYNYHTDTTTKIHLNKLNNNYIPEICHFIKIHAILQFLVK